MKLYHATKYENLISILDKHAILKGCDGVVYLADSPDNAAKFVAIRGVKDILVIEVFLEEERVEESFDHNQNFFKCKAYMFHDDISLEYAGQFTRYEL